jgi:hypothetical protein
VTSILAFGLAGILTDLAVRLLDGIGIEIAGHFEYKIR